MQRRLTNDTWRQRFMVVEVWPVRLAQKLQGELELVVQWQAADCVGARASDSMPVMQMSPGGGVSAAQAQLGQDAFTQAWSEGSAMDAASVYAYALDEPT